ncbi:MAG: penicillin-binding protein 2, partial [Alphaproteobacteria bacterium]|nr:penicillin-binding protein 2 [Alphaproteobacteria bacterium]
MPVFDRKDKSRYSTFTRRSVMMSGGMTAVFAILSGRLYQLQIRDSSEYKLQAEANRVSQHLIPPPRGRILDRFGTELANNRRNYRVLLVAEQATDGVDAALDAIATLIEFPAHQREKVLRDIAQNKRFLPVPVAENLTWEEFSRINLHLPYLPGVQPDVGDTRAYPYGAGLSHVLGYVAAASTEDKKNSDDPLLDLPGFRVGKRGIEKAYDDEVRGEAGVSRDEVNAYGRIIRQLSREPGTRGKDVWLSIDQELQQYVDARLGSESAACVVMDVNTGDVLALSSTPGFDPNRFNVGITNDEWKTLTTDDHKPLINKVLSGIYPPGSTFKTAIAVGAVQAGLDKDFSVFCTGSLRFGNHDFHCWKKGGHGHVDMHRGIQVSCDVFFYETARRLGIDAIEDTAHKLGLGHQTGIEIPGERSGVIPGRAWKLKTFGQKWQEGETLNTGIGQGYVLVTPIQLCTLASRIASGNAVLPRITRVVGTDEMQRVRPAPLPFKPETLATVRSGMDAATNEVGGTAYAWRIPDPGFEMAGKTGTAQVRVISREEHIAGVTKNEKLPWKLRDHALYIAFAPVSAPRYALSIIMEHGALVEHPHVQMARDILLFAQKRDPLKLPTAYPVNAADA